jgi:hypothetical protein
MVENMNCLKRFMGYMKIKKYKYFPVTGREDP